MTGSIPRRSFLRTGLVGAAALTSAPAWSRFTSILPLTAEETAFRPYPSPQMPPMTWAYAADESEDPFRSPMAVNAGGIVMPAERERKKFSVNARWYVPGFGYIWLSADNAGALYTPGESNRGGAYHLNYEFARSRVHRNTVVAAQYRKVGTDFSPEVTHLACLAEELLDDARKHQADGERCARLSDTALKYALWAGEQIELEHARSEIARFRRREAFFGCESRQFIWAKSEEFIKRFAEVMTFATITHYVWDSWYELFEPVEGRYNWGIKDDSVNWLSECGITIQGRPLFWFHPTVTPDWLKNKSFDELKRYVVNHTRDLVSHYGDRVLQWEVINEYHDWANIHNHTPEQITEVTRLACDTTKEVNPRVVRIINNCCPWAEYAARGRMARMDATRPLRSPRKYLQDLAEAGVDYDVLGIQIYFPQRDLSDIARLLERLSAFGKPLYITEIGASSNLFAANPSGAIAGTPTEPFAWHRHWDEELQADWLEQVYTLFYSKPSIKTINWYDFSDFRPFIVNGGLVREDSTTKQSFDRLKTLLRSWEHLPRPQR